MRTNAKLFFENLSEKQHAKVKNQKKEPKKRKASSGTSSADDNAALVASGAGVPQASPAEPTEDVITWQVPRPLR